MSVIQYEYVSEQPAFQSSAVLDYVKVVFFDEVIQWARGRILTFGYVNDNQSRGKTLENNLRYV